MGYIGAGLTRFNTADELTVTGDAEFDGNLTVKGTHITLDSATVQTVDLGDNDKIRLGDGDDLQIYHDGVHSYVKDAGTGSLFLQSSSNIYIQNAGGTANYFKGTDGGASELFHNGSQKLATTATGVDVSSTDATVNFVSSRGTGATHTITTGGANSLNFNINAASGGDIYVNAENKIFRNAAGSTEHMRIDSSGNLLVGGTSQSGAANRAAIFSANKFGLSVIDTTSFATDVGGALNLGGNYRTAGDAQAFCRVEALKENATDGNFSYGMAFSTTPNGGTFTERMRIDSSGRVGIGTVSPATPLHISGAAAASNYATRITNTATDGYSTLQLFDDQAGIYRAGSGVSAYGGASSLNILTVGAYPVTLGTSNTVRMTVAGNGNVGIGTASPDVLLDIEGASATQHINATSGNANTFYQLAGTTTGSIEVGGGNSVYLTANNASGNMYFRTGGANTRMTIDSSGGVSIGTGEFALGTSSYSGAKLATLGRSNDGELMRFENGGVSKGTITVNSSSTAYNTSSDYRLKTAVEYDWDATTRLKQLKPARFEWIVDGDDAVPVDGFLAHEVADIVPEAITGTKDGMMDEEYTASAATGDIYTPAVAATYNEDGVELTAAIDEVIHSADVEQPEELEEGQQWRETTAAVMGTRSVPDYQGIDQSKLVPLLCKTILELEARIAALETA